MTVRLPRLLAISRRRDAPGGDLGPWLTALAGAGVDGVQIREKDLADRGLMALVERARAVLPASTCLLVNGRFDVAVAAGADGVHLPSDGLPAAELRRALGDRFVIGCATHSLAEVAAARDAGADYVTFGPVFATPGKERFGPPIGLGALERAAALGIPVYPLGGVTIARLPEVAAAGAAGVAAIRMFEEAGRLAELVARAEELFARPRVPTES